jgi:hypothetical protein
MNMCLSMSVNGLFRASVNGPCSYPPRGPRPCPKHDPMHKFGLAQPKIISGCIVLFSCFGSAHQTRPKCTSLPTTTLALHVEGLIGSTFETCFCFRKTKAEPKGFIFSIVTLKKVVFCSINLKAA